MGGKVEIVSHLLSLNADTNFKSSTGDTVLMKACEKGDKNLMDMLLSQFSNDEEILISLTAQNIEGNNSLMKACAKGNLKVLVYLIKKLKKYLRRVARNPDFFQVSTYIEYT